MNIYSILRKVRLSTRSYSKIVFHYSFIEENNLNPASIDLNQEGKEKSQDSQMFTLCQLCNHSKGKPKKGSITKLTKSKTTCGSKRVGKNRKLCWVCQESSYQHVYQFALTLATNNRIFRRSFCIGRNREAERSILSELCLVLLPLIIVIFRCSKWTSLPH